MERQHWLSIPPPELKVGRILYLETDSWGFGPGGNETGVVLYELPQSVSEVIGPEVTQWTLQALPGHLSWEATPLRERAEWFHGEGALPQVDPTPIPRLHNYLNRYGFGVSG